MATILATISVGLLLDQLGTGAPNDMIESMRHCAGCVVLPASLIFIVLAILLLARWNQLLRLAAIAAETLRRP
jgi:hypothetical protein